MLARCSGDLNPRYSGWVARLMVMLDMELHAPADERTAARLRIVEEHLRCENAHDLAGIMATFGHDAEYEDTPWGEHHLGRKAVEEYYRDILTALPDLRIDVQDRIVTDDAVVLEVSISGTQTGTWRGLPATGDPCGFHCAASTGSQRTASSRARGSTTIGPACCGRSVSTMSPSA